MPAMKDGRWKEAHKQAQWCYLMLQTLITEVKAKQFDVMVKRSDKRSVDTLLASSSLAKQYETLGMKLSDDIYAQNITGKLVTPGT